MSFLTPQLVRWTSKKSPGALNSSLVLENLKKKVEYAHKNINFFTNYKVCNVSYLNKMWLFQCNLSYKIVSPALLLKAVLGGTSENLKWNWKLEQIKNGFRMVLGSILGATGG